LRCGLSPRQPAPRLPQTQSARLADRQLLAYSALPGLCALVLRGLQSKTKGTYLPQSRSANEDRSLGDRDHNPLTCPEFRDGCRTRGRQTPAAGPGTAISGGWLPARREVPLASQFLTRAAARGSQPLRPLRRSAWRSAGRPVMLRLSKILKISLHEREERSAASEGSAVRQLAQWARTAAVNPSRAEPGCGRETDTGPRDAVANRYGKDHRMRTLLAPMQQRTVRGWE
jgi:hypothetical protein